MNKIISRKLATDAIDGIMTQLYHIALSGSAENAADQINFVTILQELVQLRHNDDYKTALEQMSMEGFTEYYTLFFDLVNAMGLESVKDLSDWRVVSTDTLPDSISRANRTREVVELLDGFNALELADVSFTDRMKTIERILGDLFVTDNKEQQILKILASMNAEEQSAFITRLTDDDNPLLERMLRKVGGKEKISLFQFLQTIFLASDLNIEGSANGPTLHNDPSNYQSVEARIRKGKIAVTQFGQVQINGAVTQTGSWELSPFDQVTYALRDESYTIPALFLTDQEALSAAVGKETFLSVLWGAMQGEFNEDPTGKQILADIGINFIPIVGQVCDARDIAACLHKLINEGRVTDVMVWVTLLLTAIGCIPYAGDVVKGALKAIIKGADDVAIILVKKVGGDNIVQAIQIVSRKLDDALPELRRLIQGWAEEAAQKGSPNTAGFFSKMDEMINNSVRFIRDKIDDFGRKVGGESSNLLHLSTCSKNELITYLKKVDETNLSYGIKTAHADQFMISNKWPSDIQIPKSPTVLNHNGMIDWTQAPEGGYVLDSAKKAIKSDYTPYIGEVIDRYGPPNGRYTSPVIDGKPFTYEQRALPFIEDKKIYHQYVIQQNIKDIEEIVKRITDGNVKRRVEGFMRSNGLTYSDLKVKKGIINSAFKSVGGGIQYEFPLPIELLESIGILKQIN